MKIITTCFLLLASFVALSQDLTPSHISRLNVLGIRTENYNLDNPVIRKDFHDILRLDHKRKVNGALAGTLTSLSAILIVSGTILMATAERIDYNPDPDTLIGLYMVSFGVIKLTASIPFWAFKVKRKRQRDQLRLKYRL